MAEELLGIGWIATLKKSGETLKSSKNEVDENRYQKNYAEFNYSIFCEMLYILKSPSYFSFRKRKKEKSIHKKEKQL